MNSENRIQHINVRRVILDLFMVDELCFRRVQERLTPWGRASMWAWANRSWELSRGLFTSYLRESRIGGCEPRRPAGSHRSLKSAPSSSRWHTVWIHSACRTMLSPTITSFYILTAQFWCYSVCVFLDEYWSLITPTRWDKNHRLYKQKYERISPLSDKQEVTVQWQMGRTVCLCFVGPD